MHVFGFICNMPNYHLAGFCKNFDAGSHTCAEQLFNYSKATLPKFWVYDKRNCTKVFKLKMGSYIYVKIIFNDFEIICWEILVLFTNKVH